VGIENNRVVTVYAIGENNDVSPFVLGQSVEEIFNSYNIETNIEIEFNDNGYRFELSDTDLNLRPLIQLGDVFVQLYIDNFTGTLSSIRYLNNETLIKLHPYELVYRGEFIEPTVPSEELWRSIEEGVEREIFDISNVLRVRHGLHPLLWDADTALVAYGHSKDMSDSDDFSHISKQFGDLNERLKSAKVTYLSAGENIAANYSDGPAVVEGWLNSKAHRESLLSEDFTHLGVGVYQKYYTQNFIRKSGE
jgi:uncharacterized protein YkwD